MKSKWLAFLCLGFLTAGCALNRGEVAVQVPETANPESTALVKIVEVSDDRVFAIDPPQPSTPSLMNDEIDDPLITSRAVARKRNTYGAALGDILLPQGQTVEALVEDALAKALKEEGYKVVAEGDPGYAQALSLKARILEFWAWMTPGFWEIALEHQSRLMLEGDWPVDDADRDVAGYARVTSIGATTAVWKQVLDKGLANLIENIKGSLRSSSKRIGISAERAPPGAPVDVHLFSALGAETS